MRSLGPYFLAECIGTGGMAEVWAAQRVVLGARKTMAIKLLAPNLAAKSKYLEMFQEEARLSMLLSNSNIVQVFDAGQIAGECYMAMEWVDGANLAELQAALWSSGRSIPSGLAMYIIGETLQALEYAHNVVSETAETIVHRDVSPANIMLSIAGEVKLTDFGVARFGSEETSGLHVKGKLRYMPAEQLQGRSKEGTVDLYSAGAILQEMLDGFKFRGTNTEEGELLGMIFGNVVPNLANPASCSRELDALRLRLLEPNPSRRIGSAREALRQLRACPGYRVAAHELQALVRWYRGLSPEDTHYRPYRMTEITAAAMIKQTSETSLVKFGGASGPDSGRQRLQRVGAATALAAAGLFVITISTVFAVLNFKPPGQSLDQAVAHAKTAADLALPPPPAQPSPQPPAAVAEPTPSSQPAPPPPPLFDQPSQVPDDPEDVPIIEEDPPPPDDTEVSPGASSTPPPPPPPPDKPKVPSAPVPIKVAAGGFGFAYVKIGKRTVTLEPSRTLELPPGRYSVQVRFSAKDPWVRFGRITIQPKQRYTLLLKEPKGFDFDKIK